MARESVNVLDWNFQAFLTPDANPWRERGVPDEAWAKIHELIAQMRANTIEEDSCVYEGVTYTVAATRRRNSSYWAVSREVAPEQPKNRGHSWYHDGVASQARGTGNDGERIGILNRVCQTCGFREVVVGEMDCLGTFALHRAAFEAGRIQGLKDERERVRRVLGL